MAPPKLIALASLLVLLGAVAPPAGATLSTESMYRPDTVVAIDLTLPPASVEALEADPGEYVEGSFSLAETDGTPAGVGAFSAPLTVGVRLKGSASFSPLTGKAAFKVKFNEFVGGQKFLGLKRMTLNSMVQDPSMTHEALAYEAFRAAGVAAPRTGFARVRVDGEEFGLYLNLETVDEVALEHRYGDFEAPPQHLYEGELGADVRPGGAGDFQVDEGDEEDRADLEALIEAVDADVPAGFAARVEHLADLGQMTRMWAVERYIAHWDSYSGRAAPNNYYLYSDPAGVFQMLPWGTDQTWGLVELGFAGPGGILFEGCLADPPCEALFRQALAEVGAALAATPLDSRATQIAALLAPWQAQEMPPRKPFSPQQIAADVATTRHFIAVRPARLAAWLREDVDDGEAPVPTVSQLAPAAAPGSPPDERLSGRLNVDRSRIGDGLLVTRLALPAPGSAVQVGWISTPDGPHQACRVEHRAEVATTLTSRCLLSERACLHLGARWLRVRLETRFRPEAGEPTAMTRSIRLPRQAPDPAAPAEP